MYNHKLRGRPDDPKNKAMSAQRKSLAETLRVNSLSPSFSSMQPSEVEIARCRQHYNEFKKSYELKHVSTKSIPTVAPPKLPIIKETPYLDMYKLDPPAQATSTSSVKLVETKSISERPHNQAASDKNSVPSWTMDTQTLYSRYPNDTQAMLLIEKLKDMELAYEKIPQQTVGTQSVLEQAEKEASVAQDQLQAIQRLIMVDKSTPKPSTSLGTIEEEEIEAHPKGHRKQVVDAMKKKMRDSKQRSMVMTLNNLNQRIQHMHEKYFNEPRFKYMSLNDVKRITKFEKSIETLYKNDGFDPEKEISEVLLSSVEKPSEEHVVHERHSKPVNVIRKSASIPVERNQFCSDISSDNYLLNKNVRKRVRFEEPTSQEAHHVNHPVDTQTTMNDASWVTVDATETEASRGDPSSSICPNITSLQEIPTDNVDVLLSPRASGYSKSSSTLQSIQETILKSEFLMKEFDLSTSDLTTGLSNYEASQNTTSNSSRRSMAGLPSLQEFFSATSNNKSASIKKAYMEDSIRTQLKHSLYDIF